MVGASEVSSLIPAAVVVRLGRLGAVDIGLILHHLVEEVVVHSTVLLVLLLVAAIVIGILRRLMRMVILVELARELLAHGPRSA